MYTLLFYMLMNIITRSDTTRVLPRSLNDDGMMLLEDQRFFLHKQVLLFKQASRFLRTVVHEGRKQAGGFFLLSRLQRRRCRQGDQGGAGRDPGSNLPLSVPPIIDAGDFIRIEE